MKALALFSGGLDSTLAIKVILEQGIEVVALNFSSSFCCCNRAGGCGSNIKSMADKLGVKCKSIYLGQEYLDMVREPKYGYGKNLNPCIDCRIFKLKKAKEFMKKIGAYFIITGEVLGQRPMSQHRQALKTIERESGLEGLILRPLSAKLMPETKAESAGWVRRENLLDISGRSRRAQMELATSFGIDDYPCPAGGCLLADPQFSKRAKDAIGHGEFTLDNVELLKTGRYLRIKPSFRLSVGRDEKENNRLLAMAKGQDIIFEPLNLPGPTAIGRGLFDQEVKAISCKIIAWYTAKDEPVKVKVKTFSDGREEDIRVEAIQERELELLRI
ncbi:MAG: hypothetical protein ABIE75_02505 [Candidatus Omnitrophota bacterium]